MILGFWDFVDAHGELQIKDYKLCDTTLIICGSDLVFFLAKSTQHSFLGHRIGGDMVKFAARVRTFFTVLKRCNIKSILVMSGAHNSRDSSDEEKKFAKLDRARARFDGARDLASPDSASSERQFVIPKLAFSVFQSVVLELIALEYDIKFHQCMFSSVWQEVARLARDYKCPILSEDCKQYLLDLPDGVIRPRSCRLKNFDALQTNTFLRCSLYKRSRFRRFMEDLKEENLTLLLLLDYNQYGTLFRRYESIMEEFYENLPVPYEMRSKAQTIESLEQALFVGGNDREMSFKVRSLKQEVRIKKSLHFLRGKSLEENIDAICAHAGEEKEFLREEIKNYLKKYEVPCEDSFKGELKKLCRDGFYADHSATDDSNNVKTEELDKLFEKTTNRLSCYLKAVSEQSILPLECFDLMHRNAIHIKPQVDDSSLSPSSNYWLLRATRVILRLVRLSKTNRVDNEPCEAYDRVGDSYGKIELALENELEDFGPLDYTIFDLPNLAQETRKDIVLATFHMKKHELHQILLDCEKLTESQEKEVVVIKLLLRFIDLERKIGDQERLWPEFKLAILMSMIYHSNGSWHPFFLELNKLARARLYEELKNDLQYDKFIVYQITQLQATIFGYNSLNSLLGEACPRVRSENWFNSCFIYNVTKDLRQGRLAFVNQLPDFMTDI